MKITIKTMSIIMMIIMILIFFFMFSVILVLKVGGVCDLNKPIDGHLGRFCHMIM